MSRQFQHFVQRSFKFFLYIFFVSSIHGSEPILLDSFLSKIEVANDFQERKRGLMYRRVLPQDHGMLFEWDSNKIQCMWMKNTYVPLSVAYVDAEGKIINISDMTPLSKASVCSEKPALYALEVSQGVFKNNNINAGDILAIDKTLQNDK
jgi:hypothetical protein|tara:strand:+ start:257 stop:706 length:450 start_codon:yes stop_codon:yes gene_type:complete